MTLVFFPFYNTRQMLILNSRAYELLFALVVIIEQTKESVAYSRW